jgi:glycosyltransferase involved in cell wall biosynthesis
MKPEISFVIPCLNEKETIAQAVQACLHCLKESGISGEVVVADNGSNDGSSQLAEAAGARIVHVPMKGYGAALHTGITDARGEVIFMADADMSYEFSDMPRFLEHMKKTQSDMVVGCRFPRGGGSIDDGAMPWMNKHVGNPVLSGLARVLFRIPVQDFHCGARLIRKDKYLKIPITGTGMEYATEMIVSAHRSGLKITQVPITLRRSGRKLSTSHLRSIRDGLRHVMCMLKLFI